MERLRPLAALAAAAAVAAALALLGGCDSVFTTSPLSFLQRDPDDMSLDQRINFAEDALASGDEDAISDAYDAIKDDAAASTDSELHLLAAQLAMSLSGLDKALDDLLNIDFAVDRAGNAIYINGMVGALDATYVAASAAFYQSAAAQPGASLGGTDYILGAMAMLAEATATAGGGDVEALDSADVASALLFLQAGQAAVGADDPSYSLISDFYNFLDTQF